MKRFPLVPNSVRFSQNTSLTFNKKKSLEATTNMPDTKNEMETIENGW